MDLEVAKQAVADETWHPHLYGPQPEGVDWEKDVDPVMTDKQKAKIVGCTICQRPMVVSAFYVPAWAKCSICVPAGESKPRAKQERGSAVVVQAGRTDPAVAKDLATVLINRQFAEYNCPLGCGPMELKSVSHNDNYGPSKLIGYDNKGQPTFKQVATGETVMHQCNECKCTVNISTTAQQVFKRQNEERAQTGRGANAWADVNGVREEEAA